MTLTGADINNYFVCKRKFWLSAHDIEYEQDSDAVRMGRLLHESGYDREKKELDIDDRIVLDWFDAARGVAHENKKSDVMEEAHIWQVLYYLFYLKQKGLKTAAYEGDEGITGELNYPLLKSKVKVILTPEKERELADEIIPKIEALAAAEEAPPIVMKKICKGCAYMELCFS
ncbi:CRISPR-associated protein Cas4 [Ignavibacteria bacterium]|nr:CRISPR-associated protein Cas4 [Bacteroidota bacterium]